MSTISVGKATDVDAMRIQTQTLETKRTAGNLRGASRQVSPEKIDQVAQEFEAQFISQMLENMFSTVETGGVLGAGEGEEVYRSMMIDEYGKLMSRSGGIGVADHVKREMLRMQEVE
jgi:peptidoglycan hydrolase FlgJ